MPFPACKDVARNGEGVKVGAAAAQRAGAKRRSLDALVSEGHVKTGAAVRKSLEKKWGLNPPQALLVVLGALRGGLLQQSKVQPDLFSLGDEAKEKKLMAALDAVNSRFGRAALHLASTGINSPWQMKREKLSPRSTTSWQELPRVKPVRLK